MRAIKGSAYAGLLLGLTGIIALVVWQGFQPVARALIELGAGVLLLLPPYAVYLAMGVWSWRLMFAAGREPPFGIAVTALWIGSSVNTLLPVATLGGEAVKARILTQYDVGAAEASGSVVGDTTVQALSLVLWGLIGAGLLAAMNLGLHQTMAAAGGSLLLGGGVVAFMVVQRKGGVAALSRLLRRAGAGLSFDAAAAADSMMVFDGHVRAIYDRPARVVASTALRLAARIFLTTEIWIAAWLMGHPLSMIDAIVIRSLAGAVRGAAFVVPNGLGVQEGAYVLFGLMVGLPPELALSLSLAVRARELLSSVPGLLVWQQIEGVRLRRFLRRHDSAGS